MLWCKDCTAILVGLDRGLKSSDFSGYFHDLGFVKTDTRPEYRYAAGGVGAYHCVHGLAGHLSQALAGDKDRAVFLRGDALSDLHHKPAHDDGEQLLRTMVADGLLDLGKWHTMEENVTAVLRDLSGKLLDLEPSPLRSVGRGFKVYRLNHNSPLCDHIPRHGRINASGKQQQSPAAGTYRDSAGAVNTEGIDECVLFPDLHGHSHVGVMDVHRHLRELLKYLVSQLRTDLRRLHREFLISAFGVDLKGACAVEGQCQVVHCVVEYGLH